tara:strand:- start:12 stop:281 length:270 start_codon:yes stop_codon:yes gene_type:complete
MEILLNSDFYGFIAALLTTLAFFPQVIKTWRTKSADDISFSMLLLFLSGVACWIFYGFLINSLPIILANLITFILNFTILFLKIMLLKN